VHVLVLTIEYLEKFKIKCTASVVHSVEVISQIRKLRKRNLINYKHK